MDQGKTSFDRFIASQTSVPSRLSSLQMKGKQQFSDPEPCDQIEMPLREKDSPALSTDRRPPNLRN